MISGAYSNPVRNDTKRSVAFSFWPLSANVYSEFQRLTCYRLPDLPKLFVGTFPQKRVTGKRSVIFFPLSIPRRIMPPRFAIARLCGRRALAPECYYCRTRWEILVGDDVTTSGEGYTWPRSEARQRKRRLEHGNGGRLAGRLRKQASGGWPPQRRRPQRQGWI